MRRLPLAVSCLALLPLALPAVSSHAVETVEEIEACMQGNFPDDSSIQEIAMRSFDRVGNPTDMEAKILWKKGEDGNNALIEFDEPPDMRGAAVLMIEKNGRNDMFMYVPELKKVRRVTSHMMSGSMFGTDFSYEEFERLQGMSDDTSSERGPDEEVAGRPVYVMVSIPAEDSGSDYEKVRSLVDQETCIPLRVEFFRRGDQLRKVLETDFSKATEEASGWLPRELVMNDVVEGTRTMLTVESIEVNAEIPRKRFTRTDLERRGR